MSTALLELDSLAVSVPGGLALRDVNLILLRGGSLGIVGETGSGKSLTCRVIAGLLARIDARVVGGTARFDGMDLAGSSAREWRSLRGRRIALVPQASMLSLDPLMRVGRQLEETVRTLTPEEPAADRARALIDAVGLPRPSEVLRAYPHELSGGMRQRVMIALALAGRPELLLADEPTTALDVITERGVLELLKRTQTENEMAMVLVSHDLAVVESAVDYVAIMYAGRTVEIGPVDEVINRPVHPYTRALIASQASRASRGKPLRTIGGTPPSINDESEGCAFAPRCPSVVPACTRRKVRLRPSGAEHLVACIRADEVAA